MKLEEIITEALFDEALKKHQYVVVDFYADWCGPCKVLEPIFKKLSEDTTMNEIKFIKINVDNGKKLAKRYQISSIPTIIYFNNQEQVNITWGLMQEAQLKKTLQNLIDKAD